MVIMTITNTKNITIIINLMVVFISVLRLYPLCFSTSSSSPTIAPSLNSYLHFFLSVSHLTPFFPYHIFSLHVFVTDLILNSPFTFHQILFHHNTLHLFRSSLFLTLFIIHVVHFCVLFLIHVCILFSRE